MEEIGVLQDLRWLVQEGLVTEFATGELQILGRPPQPPAEKKPRLDHKPEATPVPDSAGDSTATTPASEAESIATPTAEGPEPEPTPTAAEAVVAAEDIITAEAVFQDEGNPLPNYDEANSKIPPSAEE